MPVPETVDAYIAGQPEVARRVLARVRAVLRAAVPAAEESIAYEIPTLKVNGRVLFHIAGWKKHYALYPARGLAEAFKDDLAPFEIDKGTIRFPISAAVPEKLIERMAKYRAAELAKESA